MLPQLEMGMIYNDYRAIFTSQCLMSCSTLRQGYPTASPVLEYPPRRLLSQLKITDGPDMNNVVPSLLSPAAPEAKMEMHDSILQAMRSDANRFTTQPFSQGYKSVLEKRLQLPVYKQLPKFCRLFSKSQVIIVTGGTGTGKTTQIPQFVAYCDIPHLKGKMIAVTQPRRVTTVSVAGRVAAEMDVELGREVGYSIRFDDKTTPGVTFLRYMTDGTLIHEAMSDPEFTKYSTIIIDEAHERTVSTDTLMALLKSVAKKRPNLKIIIMSATLDAPTFRRYFSLDGITPAPALNIKGQSYPVEKLYIKQSVEDYVETAIMVVMSIHSNSDPGDILLFLTGEDEIERACKRISELVKFAMEKNTKIGPLDCIPLYSLLGPDKQKRIFDPAPKPRFRGSHPGRKVIISTNIAETSLTIDGIYYVVDCGYSKQKVFIPRTKTSYLRPMRISKASSLQREGRAGRTGPGKCYKLYTKSEFDNLVAKTRPEVLNVDLSEAVLKLLKIGVKSEELLEFDFIDSPTSERVACALETLNRLGAVDKENNLTALGRMMAEFPLDPRLSKALIESVNLKCFEEIVTIAAMLSVQSVWRKPYGEQYKADQAKILLSVEGGDQLTLLNVYKEYVQNSCEARWAIKNYLSVHALEEATKVRAQLYEMLDDRYQVKNVVEEGEKEPTVLANVEKALVAGYYMQVAVRGKNGTYMRVKEVDKQPLKLHPACVLRLRNSTSKWIIYDELVRNNKDPIVRTVMGVCPKMLLEIAPEYFDPQSFPDGFIKTELIAALGKD